MSGDGPTTAGSIVGKLKMDRSDWIAGLAATKSEKAQLEASDTRLHIDSNAREVVEGLDRTHRSYTRVTDKADQLSAASRRLTAAQGAADAAFAKAELAQKRLNETRDRARDGSARLMSAEIALTEAMRRLDAANDSVTRSEGEVAAAQLAAAAAAQKKRQEEDEARFATVKANEANRTSATRIGMITTAVGLLLPLMAPVAAGAVGIGTALLGMGVAGVFALVGINREMKQGTELGRQYSAGTDSMKASLSQLASTAAVNMLSSFNRVVAETRDNLPFLNQQVGTFSAVLGRSGANAVSGMITSLRVMNPLMMTAAIWVEQLSVGFKGWTENGGLEAASGYALGALPKVIDLLGALGAMVLHVLQALAPLGEIGIAVLIGISNVIGAIPVEVLSALIGMVTWGAIAFKAWGFIAPMLSGVASAMGAVGAATTIATGPIGWVVAGLGALAAIIAVAAANTRGATAAIADYTYAVQQDNGAIAENVRLKAAQKLVDSGAADAARKLGIDRELLMRAVLNETGAQKELNSELAKGQGDAAALGEAAKAAGLSLTEYGLATETVKQAVAEGSAGITGAVDAYRLQEETLGRVTDATALQASELERSAAAAGVSAEAYRAVDASQGDMAFQTEKATAQMYIQNDAADLLKQALDLLNGKAIDAAQAQNRFESQLINMPSYVDEATGAIDSAGASLEGMSAAAIDNRGSLLSQIDAAQLSAQAFRDEGASSEEARQKLIASKDAIVENAVAHGMNRGEVQAYIDKLFQIPAEVPKTKVEVDTERAQRQIETFLANVSSRVATIQVRATMPDLNGAASGSGRPGVALGGTIPGLAGGGSGGTVAGPGTAGSDTAGLFRLARGEEVVSNVFGQASRHRGLLKQINAGVAAPTLPSTPAPVATAERRTVVHEHHHKWYLTASDPLDLSQKFANRMNQLGG